VSGPSISFDRAAEYYDRTRALTPEAGAAVTDLLVNELRGHQPALEIGVGTGLVSLPLHGAGIRMAGADLSAAMVAKLVEKAGGGVPFPIVLADATRLPLADAVFGAALARHVLHLIPDWEAAVRHLVRVIAPGGVLLVDIGVPDRGPWHEVGRHLEELLGATARRVGLEAEDLDRLEALIAELGGRPRELPPIWQPSELTLERYFRETEEGLYSWTWNLDPAALHAAIDDTRGWGLARFGSLGEVLEPRFSMQWHAYDLA
jgi:ubiquinone/menaquinone biosynthesis C-methylase UbiE